MIAAISLAARIVVFSVWNWVTKFTRNRSMYALSINICRMRSCRLAKSCCTMNKQGQEETIRSSMCVSTDVYQVDCSSPLMLDGPWQRSIREIRPRQVEAFVRLTRSSLLRCSSWERFPNWTAVFNNSSACSMKVFSCSLLSSDEGGGNTVE